MTQVTRVGVSAIIICENQILLGCRQGSHGANTWAPPGGHIEWFESPEKTVHREVTEETGLKTSHLKPIIWTNDCFEKENKHYITLFYEAHAKGKLHLNEPDKCKQWKLFHIDHLPEPLFIPFQHFIEQVDLHTLDSTSNIQQ